MERKIHWYPVLTAVAGGLVLLVILIVAFTGSGTDGQRAAGPQRQGPMAEIDPVIGDRLMNRETRLETIRQQAEAGNRSVAPLVRQYVQDRDPEIRIAAIEALVALDDDEGTLAIRGRTEDREIAVRLAAAEAMGKLFNPRAAAGLRDMLDPEKQREPRVRAAAATALAEVADDRGSALLLGAVDDPEPQVRLAAARALALRNDATAAQGLARAMMDADAEVRAAAEQAPESVRQRAIEQLDAAVARGADLPARLDAARGLAARGEPALVGAMLGLLEDLPRSARRDEGPAQVAQLKEMITEAIIEMGSEGLDAVAAAAVDGQAGRLGEEVAAAVCIAFGEAGAAVLSDHILAWRLYPDAAALRTWVEALGRIGEPVAARALDHAAKQHIPGMNEQIEQARRRIEDRSGESLEQADTEPLIDASAEAASLDRPLPSTPSARVGWAGVPEDGAVRVMLEAGLLHGHRREDLHLELVRRDGAWEEAFAVTAIGFNKRSHHGRLVSAETATLDDVEEGESDKLWQLKVEIAVFDDFWVRGGFAEYELTFREEDGTGRFNGVYNEQPLRGLVEGASWPLDIQKGFAAVGPGEYPRLLMRAGELDSVRARWHTPFGRAVVDAVRNRVAGRRHLVEHEVNWVTTWEPGMDAAIGHGLLAQLFDDPEHGRRAAALMMERTRTEPYGGEHGELWPGPMSLFPFAWDLGHRWLSEEERAVIAGQFAEFYGRFDAWQGPRGIMAVHYGILGLPGTMALATLHDEGPMGMDEPRPPRPVVTIEAPEQAPSTEGRPVNVFEPGAMMAHWLMIGPFGPKAGEADDPLEPIGGRAEAAPTEGATVPHRGATLRFVTLPESARREVDVLRRRGDYLAIPGADGQSRSYLYSLLEVSAKDGGTVDLLHPLQRGAARMWINGLELTQGDIVLLETGQHHVMVEVEGAMLRPSLARTDARAEQAGYHRQKWRQQAWEEAVAEHDRTGARQNVALVLGETRSNVRAHLLNRLWDEEKALGAFDDRFAFPFVYAAWVSGQPMMPDTPLPLEALGDTGAVEQVSSRLLVFAMGLVPEGERQVLADEFDRRFASGGLSDLGCLELAAALVNYPADRLDQWPSVD